MPKSEKPGSNQKKVFETGRIVILIAGLYFFSKLTRDSYLILAIVSCAAWFVSFYLYLRIPNKTGQGAILPALSIIFGAIELAIIIILLTNVSLKKDLAVWVIPMNMFLGTIGILSLYNAVAFYKYPGLYLSTYPPPPPDPIENFPIPVKEIINEGREKLFKATAIPSFLLLGVGTFSFLWIFPLLNDSGLILLLYILANGIGVGIVVFLRHMAARNWQERALESGVPNETLEEAAKLGGVPWLKIKEE